MPARKQNPNDAVVPDTDDLLTPELPAQEFPVDYEDVQDEATPEEAAEMAALQAELSKPLPSEPQDEQFVPYEQLTPAQKKIRDLRDQVAKRSAIEAERAEVQYDRAEGSDVIQVHVLEDGFTACGQVWYRGQEIRFPRGGEAYEQTKDRNGTSWLDLDEPAQWRRWGKKMFGLGPWPGLQWGDTSMLTDPAEIAAAKQAAAREARRRAAAPIIRA